MTRHLDTIFALSSGPPPSGIAVVRVSGPEAGTVLRRVAGCEPEARRARLRPLRHPDTGDLLDRGLALYFPGPGSATGEDCAEFHLHGGRAVVAAVLGALETLPGCRLAEAGEFTRRAFENRRLDLTEVEGLADLIAAETEAQRIQALRLSSGALARRAERWRTDLIEARAALEADLDFSDEEDVPGEVADRADLLVAGTLQDVGAVLDDGGRGERIRDGLQVAILGPPNAGKSSLLNALAGREAAIVMPMPGTTRDVVEARLDLAGMPVTLFDTAGLRETDDPVEREGVRRAEEKGRGADVLLWLDETGAPAPFAAVPGQVVVSIQSKADVADRSGAVSPDGSPFPRALSVVTGEGLAALESALAGMATGHGGGEPPLVTRARQRRNLEGLRDDLRTALEEIRPELKAEALRRASDGIGRLTGRIDVEDVLGAIFATFCIGK